MCGSIQNVTKITVRAVAGLGIVGLACALVHPFGAVKAGSSAAPLFAGMQTEPRVEGIVERSCQNCHSERTMWPWYSYLPPLSWMIENDVHQARRRMNLSRWRDYSTEQQEEILTRLGAEVRNRQMPLPRYLSLHPEARLSGSDIRQLYDWSHRERRRLKSRE